MSKRTVIIRKRREFSNDFKRQIVKEFETGKLSIQQLATLHQIANQTLYNWVYKFSTFNIKGHRIVEKSASSTQKIKDLQQRIAELEQLVGQKQIKLEYLEKMIDLAKTDLSIDIKKNYSTQLSNGSNNIKKK